MLDLLNSNYLLHIIMLYLILNLIILLLFRLVDQYNWEFLFKNNIFGEKTASLINSFFFELLKINLINGCLD